MTDLFTDPHRYGDLDAWRREAVELHAKCPVHRIEQSGYQVVGSTPEALDAHVRSEIPRWARVVKAAGVTAQ